MRDLFFIGEKVMMHGQLQIIPQTSLLNQFLKLSMVWKISLSWNSAASRETQSNAQRNGWASILIHAQLALKALMQSLCKRPMLKWWNSRFIATEMLMILHATGGQCKLLMVLAKDTTSTWIHRQQPCRPSSQRNPHMKVSNSTMTSELTLKLTTGMQIPTTLRISGNPSS